jgi:hypothetical protein
VQVLRVASSVMSTQTLQQRRLLLPASDLPERNF